MKTKTILISVMFLLGLIAAACSSDDDDKTDAGTTTPDTGTTTPDTGTTEPDTGTEPDGAAPTGACTNADDLAKLDTPEKQDDVQAKAKDCGLGCITEPDDASKAKCSADCMVKETGLSEACGGCYVGTILCAFNNCMPACLTPDDPACTKCRDDNKCTETFYTCSGLPQS